MTKFDVPLILLIMAFFVDGGIIQTETLSVTKIHDEGFGCRFNMYAWSMESFKDKLYVGTLNVKGKSLGMNLFLFGRPLFTSGGEIHQGTRADDGTWSWKRVVEKGLTCKKNFGFRKLITVGDYLYGVTGNHESGFLVVQTQDGENWKAVNDAGFGSKKNTSGRGMIVFEGFLYIGVENRCEGAQIWRHSVEADGALSESVTWEKVVGGGADTDNNHWFSDFVEYNGQLYTGSLNSSDGSQLWRSADGISWSMVYGGGNGVFDDRAIMKLIEYKGQLYVGTMNYENGGSLLVSTNTLPGSTADEFVFVYKNGNGTERNIYTWYMTEFAGRMYVGTFHAYGREEFDLFSSEDPANIDLIPETRDAFGNRNIYGIRTMTVFQGRLMIGSASNNKPLMIFEATAKTL